jgi:hypothetical protein
VVAGNGNDRGVEALENRGCPLVLVGTPAVGQVPAGDDQIRLQAVDQGGQRRLDVGAPAGADVQVGDVENAR